MKLLGFTLQHWHSLSKVQLDDSILKIIEISDVQTLKEARDIIQHIRRRELYQVSYYNCKMGKR